MSLKSLITYISNTQITKELIQRIKNKTEINLIGSNRYAKSIIIDSIASIEERDVLLICSNTEIAYKWIGYFESIENNNVLYYPPNEYLPYEGRNKSSEVEYAQLNIINQLINRANKTNIIITTERALQPHLLNKEEFIKNNLILKKGKEIEIEELVKRFSELGYQKEEVTSYEGNWSRRGDIVDVYPVSNELPIRIEFYDNVIDKIREYDPANQKTLETIKKISITQAGSYQQIIRKLSKLSENKIFSSEKKKEKTLDRFIGIVENEISNILDFINEKTILVFDEIDECIKFTDNWNNASNNSFLSNKENINELLSLNKIKDRIKPSLHKTSKEIYGNLNNHLKINLFEFESNKNEENRFNLNDKIIKAPAKEFKKLASEINKFIKNKDKVWILSAQPKRTFTLLNENSCHSDYLENTNDLKKINNNISSSIPIIIKNKNNYEMEGFFLPIWKVSLITDRELFAQQNIFRNFFVRKRKRSISSKININKINQGDYIVHKNHGIGKFIRIEKINIIGESRDYLVIQYADGKVSVAADQLASISKYRSSGNIRPKINKLGGTEWIKVKEKNKKEIKKIAIDLLKLYAEREKLRGIAYPPDGPWQKELEDSFPHQATVDQIKAVQEIKNDMESEKPMD